jgi:hypothetical protein
MDIINIFGIFCSVCIYKRREYLSVVREFSIYYALQKDNFLISKKTVSQSDLDQN